MDPALIIGILVAFGGMYAMAFLEGASFMSLLLPAPMILVFGATIAVGLGSGTLGDFIRAWKTLPGAFFGKVAKPDQVIVQMVEIAEKARREGLLSLEQEAADAKDPFLKNALQNIADGTDGDELRVLLEDELHTVIKAKKANAKFFKTLGGYAPTIGIIGTVVSLTHVLENLSKPDELGHMIAAAFVATLWGLVSANFIWLPIGDRIARLVDLENDRMTLMLEGSLAIQSGAQPRLLEERLRAMVPQTPSKKSKAAK